MSVAAHGVSGSDRAGEDLTVLRGMTWDHARGYDPLVAVSREYCAARPGVRIVWDKRSLKDFGDYPVSLLAERYDLLIVDHPFMARAYADNTLVDLRRSLSGETLSEREKASVGPSHHSYAYRDTHLALAVDAAAQVAAARGDLLAELDAAVPESFAEVLALARRLPEGRYLASTMKPADLISTFLGFCAQIAGKDFFHPEAGFDPAVGEESVERLRELLRVCHPASLRLDPIDMLEWMSRRDDIVYCAYLYGYTNYSRPAYRPRLITFHDAPLLRDARASTLLGGTGIALSRHCAHPEEAARYIQYVTSTAVQIGTYYQAGGQPADRNAWMSAELNQDCAHFFSNTLKTLEDACVRPKAPRWNAFQERAGALLNELIQTTTPGRVIASRLCALYGALAGQTSNLAYGKGDPQ